MLLLSFLAGVYAVWLLTAVLMGVTVVGVCKYRCGYSRFFEGLKGLRALEVVQRISHVYMRVLNRFLGPNVGLRQAGVLEQRRLLGPYIEHLLLFYWFGATVLVLTFRPMEVPSASTSSVLQAAAFLMLLSVNVFTDAWSLLWTKRCVARLAIRATPISPKELFVVLGQDLAVAAALMVFAQLVSNGLYAVQIGRPHEVFQYMFDPRTAIKPYAPIDPSFSEVRFPGQLVITCTTYVPSLVFYLLCVIVILLKPLYKLAFLILATLRLERPETCGQIGYVGSLIGIVGFASLPVRGLLKVIGVGY